MRTRAKRGCFQRTEPRVITTINKNIGLAVNFFFPEISLDPASADSRLSMQNNMEHSTECYIRRSETCSRSRTKFVLYKSNTLTLKSTHTAFHRNSVSV